MPSDRMLSNIYSFLIESISLYTRHIFAYLHDHLKQMAADKNVDNVQLLTQDFHVWPDLHGNRSPLADPTIKGMICGLTLTASIDNLAITYLGFVQALAVSNIISGLQLFDV